MYRKMSVVLLLGLVSCWNDVEAEDTLTQKQRTEIDNLFVNWDKPNSPGAAIGVVKNGKLIYSNGFGSANLEHEVPIDSKTVFYMASVSKHFVTFCILLLEEQGKLDLDDKIQKYLPDFPTYDSPLTIRHFIHHTSGVRDHLTLWRLAGHEMMDHIDEDAIYELIKRQQALNFTPGEKYLYSNSCYFMLTKVVAKVTGKTFPEFADENVFQPLGMKNSHFHDDVNKVIKGRAECYFPNSKGFSAVRHRFDLIGSGGLYSTVEDMVLWDQNFIKNKLGKANQKIIEKMLEEGELNNGKSCGYAFGLQNGEFRDRKIMEHGGALFGYRTHFIRFPKEGISIVVLANVPNVSAGTQARKIADIVFGEVPESPPKKSNTNSPKKQKNQTSDPKTNSPKKDSLNEYTGTFYSEELDVSYQFFLKNGKPYFRVLNRNNPQEQELMFLLKDRMMIRGSIVFLSFKRTNDQITEMVLDAGRVKNIVFTKTE